MTNELTPKFNPTEVEAGHYEKWLEADVSNLLEIPMQSLIASLFHHQM